MRIAVIGSGISGLAAAYYLSRKYEVSLFERDARLGGHTHTVMVPSAGRELPIDTGFIVHNDRTYPNLVRLFRELGVATQPSDMCFAVRCHKSHFEYSSRGLRGFFAQRSNVLRLRQYRLLSEILRFNRSAPALLRQPGADRATIADFLAEGHYHPVFIERYLYPMASAVWSMAFDAMGSFPAATLVRFFDNHGMLGINTHPKWKVVSGGSHSYLKPITSPYRDRIFTGAPVNGVARHDTHVVLKLAGGNHMSFDQVVFACHGDQVLPLLEAPTDAERDVLSLFTTSRNVACLHTDSSLLPRRPQARASWNYNLGLNGRDAATVTYDLNRLQSLQARETYCVTLNASDSVDRAKVLQEIVYHHPLYTRDAIRAQQRWHHISGRNRTHFCGAWWYYGFHEDGLNSALRVARSLGVNC